MKQNKMFNAKISVLVMVGLALFIFLFSILIINKYSSYSSRLRSTKLNLHFSRKSINLFFEQNDRFPESLHELNAYAKKGEKI